MFQPLIVTAFKDNVQMALVTVVLMIACIYNLSKEGFQMFDEVSTVVGLAVPMHDVNQSNACHSFLFLLRP